MPLDNEELRRIQELSQARQAAEDQARERLEESRGPESKGSSIAIYGLMALVLGAVLGFLYFMGHPDLLRGPFPQPSTTHLFAKSIVSLSLGLTFGILGHVMLVAILKSSRQRQARTATTIAVVEHQDLVLGSSSSDGGNLLYTLMLTLAYAVNDEVHRTQIRPFLSSTNMESLLERWKSRYPMGSEVQVWYHPDFPGDVGLKPPGESRWLNPVRVFYFGSWLAFGFGVVGIIAVTTGLG